jgi:hypothetical protein
MKNNSMKKNHFILRSFFICLFFCASFFYFSFLHTAYAQCLLGICGATTPVPPPTPSGFQSNTVNINTNIPNGAALNIITGSDISSDKVYSGTVANGISGETSGVTSSFYGTTITNPYTDQQVQTGAYTTVTNNITGEVDLIISSGAGQTVFNVCVTGCNDGGGGGNQGIIYTTPVANWVVANGQQDYYAMVNQSPAMNADIWVGRADLSGDFVGTEYTGNGLISFSQVGNGGGNSFNVYGIDQPWCHVSPSASPFINGYVAVVNLDPISVAGDYTCNMTIGGGATPHPQTFTIHYHVLNTNSGSCDPTAVGSNQLVGCIYSLAVSNPPAPDSQYSQYYYNGYPSYSAPPAILDLSYWKTDMDCSTLWGTGCNNPSNTNGNLANYPSGPVGVSPLWAPNEPTTLNSDIANVLPYTDWYNQAPNLSMTNGVPGGDTGGYAMRWKSTYTFTGGQYTFTWGGTSGMRIFIDNNNDNIPDGCTYQSYVNLTCNNYLINDWTPQYTYPNPVKTQVVTLPANKQQIDVEYNSTGGIGVWYWNGSVGTYTTIFDQAASLSWAPVAAQSACDSTAFGTNQMVGCQFNSIDLSGATYGPAPTEPGSIPADNATPLPDSGNIGGGTSGLNGLVYNYSMRFKGKFNFTGGTYNFTHGSDDGMRVYIDDNNDNSPDSGYLVNDWNQQGYYLHSPDSVTIPAGQHQIDVEYFQGPAGAAEYSLSWAQVAQVNPINGVCGSANQTYPFSASSYGSDTYCSSGTANATPSFPSAGTAVNWACTGSSGGSTSGTCTATHVSGGSGGTCALTITKTIGGSVTSGDGSIACGTNCVASVSCASGTETLTAVPDSAYWKFTGWSGDCSGSSSSVTVSVNKAKTCIANFVPQPFQYQEF